MTSPVSLLKGRLRSTPLRFKLVASVLALVAAALLVISVMTTVFLHSYLVDQVDSELRTASTVLATVADRHRP